MPKAFTDLPPVFHELLPTEALIELRRRSTVRTASKGEVVVQSGSLECCVLALRSGMLAVAYKGAKDAVAADFIRRGEVYCSTVQEGVSSVGDVQALTASSVLLWPTEVFRGVLMEHPKFAMWYLETVQRRLSQQYYHRARIVQLSSDAQYAYFLWSMSELLPDGRRVVRTKIPQSMIASYLGITREEVSRRKTMLEKTGHIVRATEGLELLESLGYLLSFEDSQGPIPSETAFLTGLRG